MPGEARHMPKIRRVPIDSYPENIAFLVREGDSYSPEQFQALRKVRVSDGRREILATLNIVDDGSFVRRGEIGLGEQAFRRLTSTASQAWLRSCPG
jgi:thymidine phosphorylase